MGSHSPAAQGTTMLRKVLRGSAYSKLGCTKGQSPKDFKESLERHITDNVKDGVDRDDPSCCAVPKVIMAKALEAESESNPANPSAVPAQTGGNDPHREEHRLG